MKHEITIDHDRELIMVRVSGDLTAQTVTELTIEVGAVAAEHGIIRLLFDMREASEKATDLDAFFLAANPEKRGMEKQYRRAIVHDGRDRSYGFFETVSVNRGNTVKVFVDVDKALEWLLQDQ